MSAEKWGWASVFAVGLCLVPLAFGLPVIVSGWKAETHQAVAAWVQAIGSVVAIAAALGIALNQRHDAERQVRREAERRRREPLRALRVIVDRAHFLVAEIPISENSDIYVEHYFSHVANVQAFATAQHALQSIPLSQLVDPSAVLCIFEMQDALHLAKQVIEPIAANPDQWWYFWDQGKNQLGTAKTHAAVAHGHMLVALKDAGITDHLIQSSGAASLSVTAEGTGRVVASTA